MIITMAVITVVCALMLMAVLVAMIMTAIFTTLMLVPHEVFQCPLPVLWGHLTELYTEALKLSNSTAMNTPNSRCNTDTASPHARMFTSVVRCTRNALQLRHTRSLQCLPALSLAQQGTAVAPPRSCLPSVQPVHHSA